MFIIDKYILRRCILPFLYCFVSFVLLAILVDLFEHGDDMIEKAIPIKMFFVYYFYFVVATLPQIMPIAVLLATLYIISSFIRHNELTAMQSGGIHLLRFVGPFIFLALMISLVLVIANETIATRSARKINAIKKEYLYFSEPDNQYKNLAKIGANNRMYLIESYSKESHLMKNVIILAYNKNPSYLKSRINAKQCVWDNNRWVATQGTRIFYDEHGIVIRQDSFDATIIDIPEGPAYFDQGKKRPEEMTFSELHSYIQKLDQNHYKSYDDRIDLHNKLSIPLATFFVVLLGIPCAFLTNVGVLMNFAISMGLGLGYVVLFAVSVAFGRAGFIPPFLASWFTNMAFGLTGVVLLFRNVR